MLNGLRQVHRNCETMMNQKSTDEKKMKRAVLTGMICLVVVAIFASVSSCKKESAETNDSSEGVPAGYVDLGLPSGTRWKATNENGFFDYESAVETFGNKLPTKEQFEELKSLCTYSWDAARKGAHFVSSVNGDSIFLPATGDRDCDGNELGVGSYGSYWSSSPASVKSAWRFGFYSGVVYIDSNIRCGMQSVRLVYN